MHSLNTSRDKIVTQTGEVYNNIEETAAEDIVTFLKSNSMSKNCCVYFINKEYKDLIEPRVTFNLNKGKMILSKCTMLLKLQKEYMPIRKMNI